MSETPRSLPAKTRRKQLIKATIKCIAKNGLSGTTMADVTKLAGLSLGIVNLHFETKEKLLVETLRFITDEYRNGLDKIFFNENLSTEEKFELMLHLILAEQSQIETSLLFGLHFGVKLNPGQLITRFAQIILTK